MATRRFFTWKVVGVVGPVGRLVQQLPLPRADVVQIAARTASVPHRVRLEQSVNIEERVRSIRIARGLMLDECADIKTSARCTYYALYSWNGLN